MSTLTCLPIKTQFSPAIKLLTFIHDIPFRVFLDFSLTFDGKLLWSNSQLLHNPLNFTDAKKGPQNCHNQCSNFCHQFNDRLISWSVRDTRVKTLPFFGCRNVVCLCWWGSFRIRSSLIFLAFTCRSLHLSFIVHSCQQKSIGLKVSMSQTGSDVRYSYHHNSSRFTFPIFAHSCRFSVLHSLQSITPRIY